MALLLGSGRTWTKFTFPVSPGSTLTPPNPPACVQVRHAICLGFEVGLNTNIARFVVVSNPTSIPRSLFCPAPMGAGRATHEAPVHAPNSKSLLFRTILTAIRLLDASG